MSADAEVSAVVRGGVIVHCFIQQKDEKLEISIGTSKYEGTVSKRAGSGKGSLAW